MDLFLAAVVAVAILEVVGHFVLRHGRIRTRMKRLPGFRLLRLLMVTAWGWAVLPGLITYLVGGRPPITNLVTSVPPTGLAARVVVVLNFALVLVALVTAVHYARRNRDRSSGAAMILLAPWIFLALYTFHNDGPTSVLLAVFPLTVIAVSQAKPPLEIFSLIGNLVALTAAGSLLLGAVRPEIFTITNAGFVEKFSFLSSVLAGPFSHPNMLGSFLALGLPSVFLVRSKPLRRVGVLAVVAAVVWSASRTSIGAVFAVLAVVLFVSLVKSPAIRRGVIYTILLALTTTLIAIPLLTGNPAAWGIRGRVWIGSLLRWKTTPWFGGGPNIYRDQGSYANYLGDYAFHGHNILVDSLAVGGVVFTALVSLLLLTAAIRAVKGLAAGTSPVPVLIVVATLTDGVLEVATNYWIPGPPGLVVWLSLAAVLFARQDPLVGLADDDVDDRRVVRQRIDSVRPHPPDAHREWLSAGARLEGGQRRHPSNVPNRSRGRHVGPA